MKRQRAEGGTNSTVLSLTESPSSSSSPVTWGDESSAENKRRICFLSESLETSDIHDLQMLRRSLERQITDVRVSSAKFREKKASAKTVTAIVNAPRLSVLDEDAQWHADMLRQRLDAVTRAVEKKGGWRSAVFLDAGNVNVDVDVEPWPPGDGVLMLQTVKDALVVQLEEVPCF